MTGAWLASASGITAVALNPWNLLARFPIRSFVWFEFVSLAVAAFAAGLCATRWRNPPTLWIGIAFGSFTLYVLSTLSSLVSEPSFAKTFSFAIWWSVPTAIAAWAEAGFAIVRKAPLRGNSRWQTILKSGIPIQASWLRRFLTAVGVKPDEPWRIPWMSIVMWLGVLGITAAGSKPGVFFEGGVRTGIVWRGIDAGTQLPYVAFVVFSGIVLLATVWALAAANRQVDRPRIKQDDLARLHWAPWAAVVILLLVCGAEAAISVQAGAESLFDLAFALSAVLFALVALDAAAFSNADVLYAGPVRRAIVCAGWSGLVLYIAAVLPVRDMQRGGLVALLAFALPLLPSAARAIEGLPRRVDRPVSREAERLRKLLAGPDRQPLAHQMPSLEMIEETLSALAQLPSTGDQVQIDDSDLRTLIDGYKGGEDDADLRTDDRLSRFPNGFPPLQSDGDWDDRHRALLHLVYETASTLDKEKHAYGRHPTDHALVRVVCLKKAGTVAERDLQPELHAREKHLVLAYDVWALGDRNGTEALWFGQAIHKTDEELENEKKRRQRRENRGELLLPPRHHTALHAYNQRYPAGVTSVYRRWVTLLEKARKVHLGQTM